MHKITSTVAPSSAIGLKTRSSAKMLLRWRMSTANRPKSSRSRGARRSLSGLCANVVEPALRFLDIAKNLQ
jgi:hypothetical protein